MIESRCLRLRRKLSKKVSRIGGNAIIGYKQIIDDEGQKSQRIIIRGYGTAILLDHEARIEDGFGQIPGNLKI